MRRGNKPELIYTEDDRILGINLGSDFCAEHEWGIEPIKNEFKVDDRLGVYGLQKRKINHVPTLKLLWLTDKHDGGFVFSSSSYFIERCQADPKVFFEYSELVAYKGQCLRAAWDESGFAAVSNDPEQIALLKEIFNEFQKLNISLGFGKSLPAFDNPGLVIAIADRLPKDQVTRLEESDKEYHKLRQDFDATGIEKILEGKGKRYFALSPKRQKDGSLIFWLNPMNQDKNNFGWVTLQDLIDWSNDTGKVIIKK